MSWSKKRIKTIQNFTFLQTPKSVSLTWPSLVSITLSGFRSLCTIPLKDHKHKQHQQLVRPRTSPCKNSRASVISAVKNFAVDSGKWPIWVNRKFGRLCNVYVENFTERQHFGNIFPKGRQILGQFIFTFFGPSESEVTVPWTVNSPQKPRHPLSSRRAMRHWHLNCEVIRKHNPSLSEKNRKRIHAWQLFSTLKSLTPPIFVECQLS